MKSAYKESGKVSRKGHGDVGTVARSLLQEFSGLSAHPSLTALQDEHRARNRSGRPMTSEHRAQPVPLFGALHLWNLPFKNFNSSDIMRLWQHLYNCWKRLSSVMIFILSSAKLENVKLNKNLCLFSADVSIEKINRFCISICRSNEVVTQFRILLIFD